MATYWKPDRHRQAVVPEFDSNLRTGTPEAAPSNSSSPADSLPDLPK